MESTATVTMTDDIREVPRDVSFFKLNPDGSYEDAPAGRVPDVFIEESQVYNIWDRRVAQRLREEYGPYVGVMHHRKPVLRTPRCRTMMQVLGD